MKLETSNTETKDLDLVLRKEEIKKFINTVMYYRYGVDEIEKSKFLDDLQAIRIDEDKVILIDGFGDICDKFERDVTVTIPKKYKDELFNEFQIVLSVHGNKFYLQEII
jgi:selenophosphate synthetase-related protein